MQTEFIWQSECVLARQMEIYTHTHTHKTAKKTSSAVNWHSKLYT